MKSVKLHLWVPDLLASRGGIQTYSLFFTKAVCELTSTRLKHLFVKNETFPVCGTYAGIHRFLLTCTGIGPRLIKTLNFTIQTLWFGLIERPDLIITTHLHFAPVARLLKQYAGIPYWIIAHGIDAWGVSKPRLQAALQDADLILAVSAYTQLRLLDEQQISPSQICLLPNTVDTARFVIQPKPFDLLNRYRLNLKQPVLLTVARLDSSEQYKGYDVVLQALPSIRKQIPEVKYLLVGKGDDRGRLEKLITDLKLADCVTLVGYVPDEELSSYYNLCDLFVMPSKAEGFGIVYLEALACGKPVIAGNKDGSRDALANGELGILVNPDDPTELATEITRLLKREHVHPLVYQPELLRQRVIELFGFEAFKANLADHIDQFIAKQLQHFGD